jgi:hypothetical protein
MDVVLRFLAALAPAHLLQCLRDTKALHLVFGRTGQRPTVLSQVFCIALSAFSGELRKILTGFEIGRLAGKPNRSPAEMWPSAESCLDVQVNVFSQM